MKFKILAAAYGMASLFAAMSLAWLILFSNNYFYAQWYDHGGIAEAIEKYAPQNYHKQGFANTTREQRIDLFAQIVVAVHNQGRGLAAITYQPDPGASIPLLHRAEVVHLQDVSRLIDRFSTVMLLVAVLWLIASMAYLRSANGFPNAAHQSLSLVALTLLIGLSILILGWRPWYKLMHSWMFPAEHTWYFLYQDSLMSTMMWAPHLFTYIGITWALLSMVFFALLLCLQRLINLNYK